MNKTATLMLSLFIILGAGAQIPAIDLDKSPLDVSYYPPDFPILKIKGQAKEPLARIIYSRPQKKDRIIFGGEVKYNALWRLGANEATEIEFFKPAIIDGKKIAKGRYTLYCIPDSTNWTLIFNTDNYVWGSFAYKKEKDVLRVQIPIEPTPYVVEVLTLYFEGSNSKAKLDLAWDRVRATLPIQF